jgi:hypothetical protein
MDDVLLDWHPNIDWSAFKQGAVSERMWDHFCRLIRLCHAHAHWQQVTQAKKMKPLSEALYGRESRYQRDKRRHERKRDIEGAERHMHRAGFLAAEQITGMSYLLTKDDEGKPDWNMYWALRLAVKHQPNHTQARFNVVTSFKAFDAAAELKDDPMEIAQRWLSAAGDSDRVVLCGPAPEAPA